jgi:hypothetical protein
MTRYRPLLSLAFLSLAVSLLAQSASVLPRVTFTLLGKTPVTLDTRTWPEEIRALADREVRLTGYLLPLKTQGGRTTEFMLMRNQNTCCFGTAAVPTEYVVASAPPPGLPAIMDVPTTLRGTFRLAPAGPGETPIQLFRLEQATRL